MLRSASLMLLVVLWLAAAPTTATAQEGDAAARERARDLIASGDNHLARGDRLMARGKKVDAQESYLAALADYEAAHKAFKSPKIYFAIALAEKRLGRYIEALGHFDRLLAELDEVPEKLRAEVERHVNEVKQNLGVILFRIQPDGATLEVDGEVIGRAPLNRPHYVVPGEHEYRVHRPGYETLEASIVLEAGDVREDQLVLKSGTDPSPPVVLVERPAAPPHAPEGPAEARPLYVGLGLTGAFAAGAAVTGLLAMSRHDTFTDDAATPDDRDSARTSGRNLALVTDVLVIGAIASATYTTFYYFTRYRPDRESDGAAAFHLVPAVSPETAGVAVTGRF
jgi:hypothetical protein